MIVVSLGNFFYWPVQRSAEGVQQLNCRKRASSVVDLLSIWSLETNAFYKGSLTNPVFKISTRSEHLNSLRPSYSLTGQVKNHDRICSGISFHFIPNQFLLKALAQPACLAVVVLRRLTVFCIFIKHGIRPVL